MNKYIIFSPETKESFSQRLNFLYLKLGSYLDMEEMAGRHLQYCKVFLSDAQNQIEELKGSLLYQEIISAAACTIVEQSPLCGCKISLLVKTSDKQDNCIFQSLRLTEEEAKDKDAYQQTHLLFDKYLQSIAGKDITMEHNLLRTWIYVNGIDTNYQGMVEARNDIFTQQGLTPSTHYIASTGIGGMTENKHALVAMDFLTYPNIQEEDKMYLQAPDHLNATHEYGVAFERGTRLTLPYEQKFFISGTASIDKEGKIVYPGDIVRQTGRLLENIGALLKDGGATMNDIQYFIVYLRDLSDYQTVEKMMKQLYPQIPHLIVEAKVCRPGWLVEMECVAIKITSMT